MGDKPTDVALLKFLWSFEDNRGTVTHIIAEKFGLTNRQVGGRMGKLSRKGWVFTYTKGTIILSGGLHSKSGSPMRLSNSFYEIIADKMNEWITSEP